MSGCIPNLAMWWRYVKLGDYMAWLVFFSKLAMWRRFQLISNFAAKLAIKLFFKWFWNCILSNNAKRSMLKQKGENWTYFLFYPEKDKEKYDHLKRLQIRLNPLWKGCDVSFYNPKFWLSKDQYNKFVFFLASLFCL